MLHRPVCLSRGAVGSGSATSWEDLLPDMHALGRRSWNLVIIVALPELPCLRKTRLSVHAMAWVWETNGAN
jgi:hypothetical protein